MQEDQSAHLLSFGAMLRLAEAGMIRTALLTSLNGTSSTIAVDCADAAEVDVSFIQLLLAARRTAQARGKCLALSAPASGALLRVLVDKI